MSLSTASPPDMSKFLAVVKYCVLSLTPISLLTPPAICKTKKQIIHLLDELLISSPRVFNKANLVGYVENLQLSKTLYDIS